MSLDPPHDGHDGPRLTALPVETVAAIMRRAGARRVDVDIVRADITAGAPVNADGTVHLVAYLAWLVRRLAQQDADHGA